MTTISELRAGDVVTRQRIGSDIKLAFFVVEIGQGQHQGTPALMARLSNGNRDVITSDLDSNFALTIVTRGKSMDEYKQMRNGAGELKTEYTNAD